MPGTETDILGMADDEFLKMNGPEAVSESTPAVETPPVEKDTPATEPPAEPTKEEEPATPDNEPVEKETPVNPLAGEVPATEEKPGDPAPGSEEKEEKTEPAKEEQASIDYKAQYEGLMAPLKANGKMVDIRSPDELRQLAQMGANYTRKMQDIAPFRKALLMLQNNDLLDEGKLSFLIDLSRKEPEAIKKLLKDSNIDPMDIDVSTEPNYQAGAHVVSDNEVRFRTELDNLRSTDTGKEFIREINSSWDEQSKQALWDQPQMMSILYEQQQSGVYGQIVSEIERQKLLGVIPAETSFLQAYVQVGNQLTGVNGSSTQAATQAGAVAPAAQANPVRREPEVIATRPAAPKPAVTNSDKASAAAPSRSASQKAQALVNPLAMSDDEFLKQMQNRV